MTSEPSKGPAPKKLPAANEFSPGQIGGSAGLGRLLRLLDQYGGDKDTVLKEIRTRYFSETAPTLKGKQRRKRQETRAYNLALGASQYGLFDLSAYELTELGHDLLKVKKASDRVDALASHILRSLHGLEVLEAIKDMQERGDAVAKTSLQAELERRGFDLPRATTHHTKLLAWLREAEVINARYEIDDAVLSSLTGVTMQAVSEWDALAVEQQAFVRTLRKLAVVSGETSVPASDVVDAATLEYGPVFRRPDQLASRVFKPLADAGWISRTLKSKGRGGKSGTVAATKKLLATDLDLMPEETGGGVPTDLRPHLKTPLTTIHKNLRSRSKHKKGLALELLALRITIDLGLIPVRMRERSASTGGAEVDVVAEGQQLQFVRWLIQCKNTQRVNVAALAKEIGLATLLRAHVVVLVTTGAFSSAVEKHAHLVSTTTPLQVLLVPGSVLDDYAADGGRALWSFFRSMAQRTLEMKRPQIAIEEIAS